MKRILLVLCMGVLCGVSRAQTCSNQLIIRGNPNDGLFQQLLLSSYLSDHADNSQPEIVSEAWTCNGIGFPTCQFRGLFKYNVSAIPTNATVTSAKLYLYAKTNNINGNVGNPMYGTANASYLQKVTAPWSLTTTGWANQPSTTTTAQKTLAQSTTTAQDYVVDVTDFVQSWVTTPSSNNGMMLRLQAENYYNSMIFNSGQAADNLKPRLEITYTLPDITQLVIRGNPSDGLFQQLLLSSYLPDHADNSQPEIVSEAWTCNGIGFPTCQFRGLFKYNVSAIPATATVLSAKLYLYAKTNNINGNVGNPMYGTANASYLQKVTAPWSLTTTGWANQPSTTTTAQKTLAQSTSTAQDYVVDVTDFVQSWVTTPSSNNGMMLRLQAENYYNSMIFNSGQAADNLKPRLEVCYTTAAQAPLPAKLLDFSGVGRNHTTELSWKTSDEYNLRGFTVERSANGAAFDNIGFVGANNTSRAQTYSFTDNAVPAGQKFYYRLKLENLDGSYQYTKIIAITFAGGGDQVVSFYPNPARDYIQLTLQMQKDNPVSLQVSDMTGKVVYRSQRFVKAGSNSLTLNGLGALPTGVYSLQVVLPDKTLTSKLVIGQQ